MPIRPGNPHSEVRVLHGCHSLALGYLRVTFSLALLELSSLNLKFTNLLGFFSRRTGLAVGSMQTRASGGERPRAPEQTPRGRWPHLPVALRDGQDSAGWEHRQTRLSWGKGTETIPKPRSNLRSALKWETVDFTVRLLKRKIGRASCRERV